MSPLPANQGLAAFLSLEWGRSFLADLWQFVPAAGRRPSS